MTKTEFEELAVSPVMERQMITMSRRKKEHVCFDTINVTREQITADALVKRGLFSNSSDPRIYSLTPKGHEALPFCSRAGILMDLGALERKAKRIRELRDRPEVHRATAAVHSRQAQMYSSLAEDCEEEAARAAARCIVIEEQIDQLKEKLAQLKAKS